jgi:Zn-dependent peptidase ImmA (M78 family)
MTRPLDSIVDKAQLAEIRKQARAALEAAGAIGCYPTPVADVMAAANLLVAENDALELGLLERLRQKAGRAGAVLKSALSKVLGVFDAKARLVYLDSALHRAKRVFVKLHETAHAVLPWQRSLYSLVEDCEKTLAPDVADQFEREANSFASEVLFQLDDFAKRAADERLGVSVPLRLGRQYGASAYASIRRYVSTHHRACAVLILDPPQFTQGPGFVANVRRVITSPEFERLCGRLQWPPHFTPGDEMGAAIPVGGRKMSRPRACSLRDANGVLHECVVEGFTQGFQVFLLIHSIEAFTSKRIVFAE